MHTADTLCLLSLLHYRYFILGINYDLYELAFSLLGLELKIMSFIMRRVMELEVHNFKLYAFLKTQTSATGVKETLHPSLS